MPPGLPSHPLSPGRLPVSLGTVLLAAVSCSLLHQELPNDPPALQVSSADTTRVRRGGSVSLEVRASDEDDDPLLYSWNDSGAGSFSDTTSPATIWTAPGSIQGSSEFFLITATISDRQLETEDIVESFLIEVIQSPPSLRVSATDTLVPFREHLVVLEGFAEDEDGDPLTFAWGLAEGSPRALLQRSMDSGRTQANITPLFPGAYTVILEVTDGADTVRSEILLQVTVPELPETGMAALEIQGEDGAAIPYEIDLYEYPNRKGEPPLLTESWFEAARLCADQGKRLCSSAEWEHACMGPEGLLFSSTDMRESLPDAFGRRYCNTPGSATAGDSPEFGDTAPSGHFPNCSSSAGVYDLIGNAFEWTMDFTSLSERQGEFRLSGVSTDFDCTNASGRFEPIPPVGEFDIYSETEIEELLQDPLFSSYIRQDGLEIGFRCCRGE